jgi:shikimate kinase/nucleoside-diphosphate-sugar epimerase
MILVVGCGYVGEKVADLLHEQGLAVTGVTHSPESAARLCAEKPWRAVACDISQDRSVQRLARTVGADQVKWVVHCASSNRGGAEVYQQVYEQGMDHLMLHFSKARPLFTSSTSVYPQTDGSTVTETSPAEPTKETGRILRRTEENVLRLKGTVARLAGIYGPGRSFLLRHLLEGKSSIEGNEGQGRIINQIHRLDAASAVVHLIQNNLTGIYNVVDDSPATQAATYSWLAPKFGLPLPPVLDAPATDRKRGWTHKAVSNAKLHASGWTPRYPSYQRAVEQDALLVPSILQSMMDEGVAVPRLPNIIIIGLMGCGKSTVGRIVASKLGYQFADTDGIVCAESLSTIPKIFEREGEAGFRIRESAALRRLLGSKNHVIATGGGIVTQPQNLPLLRHLGFVVWLEADPKVLAARTASSTDRPLLQEEDPLAKLERLLGARRDLYAQLADLRISTDELSPPESAIGVMESARAFFGKQQLG